jgi:hypothetical protein
MFDKLKTKLMSKKTKCDFHKEEVRGALKQLMKTRGLRTISLENYNQWKKSEAKPWLHSMKIDIQDGYIYFYGYKADGRTNRAGQRLENLSTEYYDDAYRQVINVMNDEAIMPSNVKRNVLVKVSR